MINLEVERNTWRNVIDYLNNTGMEARYSEEGFIYTEGGEVITVQGREERGGLVSISEGVKLVMISDLAKLTGDKDFLNRRAEAIRGIKDAIPAARGILKSQARVASNYDLMHRQIKGGTN